MFQRVRKGATRGDDDEAKKTMHLHTHNQLRHHCIVHDTNRQRSKWSHRIVPARRYHASTQQPDVYSFYTPPPSTYPPPYARVILSLGASKWHGIQRAGASVGVNRYQPSSPPCCRGSCFVGSRDSSVLMERLTNPDSPPICGVRQERNSDRLYSNFAFRFPWTWISYLFIGANGYIPCVMRSQSHRHSLRAD